MNKIITASVTFLFIAISSCAQQNDKPKPSLNHIAQYVVDLKVSTDFYMNIIGLDTIPEPFHDNKHTWFAVGPKSHLHIIAGAAQKIPHDKNSHLCFTVNSVPDFTVNLKKNNIPFESWTGEKNTWTNRVDGVKQIYFQDPDGYWIEINDATR
ncbi:MAG: VOC family protein [Bacteroidetes bacterium]|nr:VOC family protein [Bacteroidota bacterium]